MPHHRKIQTHLVSTLMPFAMGYLLLPHGANAQTAAEVQDLQRQVGELQSKVDTLSSASQSNVKTSRSNVRLTFSGRLSAGILFADQGVQSQTFAADNDASGSRFGLLAEVDFNDITAGFQFEISAEVNSTDDIDFGNIPGPADSASDFGDVRQANAFVRGNFGLVSIGQGNTAAEDSAHADLSGTSLAGAGSDVDDIAGGLSFLPASGTALGSAGDIDAFFDIQDGGRETRLLYQTPRFNGFRFDASLASSEDEEGLDPAVGVFYEGEFASIEVEAAASYRQEDNGSGSDDFIVGSASFLHSSGLNLTLAGSQGNFDGQAEDTTAGFVKIGYRADVLSFGKTSFSVDYFRGENNDTFANPLTGALPEAESFGISVVQEIKPINTEIFLTYRNYSVSDVFVNGVADTVEDLDVVFLGARFRF